MPGDRRNIQNELKQERSFLTQGHEDKLSECGYASYDDCDASEAAGVVCESGGESMDEGFSENISYERLFCCFSCLFFCQAQGAWELFLPQVGDFSSAERAGTSSSTCT